MQQQPGQQPTGRYGSHQIYRTEGEIPGGNAGFLAYAVYQELLLPLKEGIQESYQAIRDGPIVQRMLHPRGVAHEGITGSAGLLVSLALGQLSDTAERAVNVLAEDFKTVGPAALNARLEAPLEARIAFGVADATPDMRAPSRRDPGFVAPVRFHGTYAR